MKYLIILLFPLSAFGQSVSVGYSPQSIELWGNTPYTSKLDIGIAYKSFQLEYSYIDTKQKMSDGAGNPIYNWFGALSLLKEQKLNPLFLSAGVTYTLVKFPSESGRNINFQLRTGVYKKFNSVTMKLFYSHISNARIHSPDKGVVNIGLDNISLSVSIFM